jgi:hypothetical protein
MDAWAGLRCLGIEPFGISEWFKPWLGSLVLMFGRPQRANETVNETVDNLADFDANITLLFGKANPQGAIVMQSLRAKKQRSLLHFSRYRLPREQFTLQHRLPNL